MRILFLIVLVSALVITFTGASGSGLAQSMPTASQDEGTINATTVCVGIGKDSESAANIQLNRKNTITQECEQTISSTNGNGGNYAINTLDSNSESTSN